MREKQWKNCDWCIQTAKTRYQLISRKKSHVRERVCSTNVPGFLPRKALKQHSKPSKHETDRVSSFTLFLEGNAKAQNPACGMNIAAISYQVPKKGIAAVAVRASDIEKGNGRRMSSCEGGTMGEEGQRQQRGRGQEGHGRRDNGRRGDTQQRREGVAAGVTAGGGSRGRPQKEGRWHVGQQQEEATTGDTMAEGEGQQRRQWQMAMGGVDNRMGRRRQQHRPMTEEQTATREHDVAARAMGHGTMAERTQPGDGTYDRRAIMGGCRSSWPSTSSTDGSEVHTIHMWIGLRHPTGSLHDVRMNSALTELTSASLGK
ncbi:hypothetical protein BS47DRAFT_1368278 [Hydnum rufescens UP504]|uniref:Uncharacterized protein n=1 Tax=Hydnum rufescens UP504 TaxID=1448309 RepID=A0A9P6DKI1_9AGAM|nr:hypothetical protein BS47DRAFT_1368278 [Hydnum rufescens UP504]